MTMPKGWKPANKSSCGSDNPIIDWQNPLFPKPMRRYDIFEFQNPCVMNVQSQVTVRIYQNNPFLIFGARQYLSNLKAKRSDGKPLFIAPTFETKSNSIMNEIINLRGANTIFIYLTRVDDPHQEKKPKDWLDIIDVSWTEEIGKGVFATKREGIFQNTLKIERDFQFTPSDLDHASYYVELKTNEKYEITRVEIVDEYGNEIREGVYEVLNSDKRNKVFRFTPGKRPKYAKVRWHISIPKMVLHWVWFGAIIGTAIPSIVLSISIIIPNLITPNPGLILSLIGGIIALILGLRLLLFHDIELMIRWSKIYIVIVTFGLIVSLLMLFN